MQRRDAIRLAAAGLGAAAAATVTRAGARQEPSAPGPAPGAGDGNALRIAMVMYPQLTQLDFTGPYEVLSRVPGAQVFVVAPAEGPIASDTGLRFVPTHTFATAPAADVLFVPGGPGAREQMKNPAMLAYLRKAGKEARFVTSVCTGALLLGAAGLLEGYRATTHWLFVDLLDAFGAQPVRERIVFDRSRITGAGVTSGVDFAFALAARLRGEATAQRLQLVLEYEPEPPFHSGSPRTADPALVADLRGKTQPLLAAQRAEALQIVRSWPRR